MSIAATVGWVVSYKDADGEWIPDSIWNTKGGAMDERERVEVECIDAEDGALPLAWRVDQVVLPFESDKTPDSAAHSEEEGEDAQIRGALERILWAHEDDFKGDHDAAIQHGHDVLNARLRTTRGDA